MKTIHAKVIGPTQLELSEPLTYLLGETIQIVVADSDESRAEDAAWREAALTHMLASYDEQDAIYDHL